ncbi:MAG TPA: 5-formyltetrahydrofolate cyclo-ligase [Candidatus Nanoarchaeia archaeon]|nr:5-formyltetrahydrofolate cyclo-ligase [Candidatus Nanoarchaeia archaeon]
MESTLQHKKQIRETILAKRESLKPEQVEKKSDTIQKNLSNMSAYRDAKIILGYIPIKNEVRTNKLFPNALPGFDENKNPVALKNDGELVAGPYKTKQPSYSEDKLTNFDFAIVPGIAFDEKGNRIGYGKGYYDKLLANSDATKIGLAFDIQIVDEIPAESHDVQMDFIVTETRVIPC